MKKPSQKDRIINRLLERGQITRNECLQNFISRLSAIILKLKEEGWEFKTDTIDGDYYYFPTKVPYRQVVYTTPDGKQIKKYERTN